MNIRNLIIAPIVEEIIFRACLLPPLLASSHSSSSSSSSSDDDAIIRRGLTPTKACWIAPLFFGVAHLHHFYEKYRQQQTTSISNNTRHEERKHDLILVRQLLIELATAQWTYTTLFGAYVSHVFIRTGSIMSVIVAHVICNYMGLPDIEFIFSTKSYYLSSYTSIISFMYLLGIVLFIYGFKSTTIFPGVSVLSSLLQLQ
jgi:prenyl protein peptidase